VDDSEKTGVGPWLSGSASSGRGPRVGVRFCSPSYNSQPPFHPSVKYAEALSNDLSSGTNEPYGLLRELLADLGYDRAHFGTKLWNPLRSIIRPGQTVVIKPNLVNNCNGNGGDVFAVITHPSIVRAIVDYVFLALEGRGRIIIADAPIRDCQWAALMRVTGLEAVPEYYRSRYGFPIELLDLRDYEVPNADEVPSVRNRRALPGDPAGSVIVNLGKQSHFYGLDSRRFYGAEHDRRETIRHHCGEIQEYSISKTVLSADVFISVPKLKTHCKVGVTLNMKGLVGINTNKNFLVHHQRGTPRAGGDQLPDSGSSLDNALVRMAACLGDRLLDSNPVRIWVFKALRKLYRCTLKKAYQVPQEVWEFDEGNWSGNDTAWRMVVDLVKIIYFADKNGRIQPSRQRRFFSLVDGILGGEGNGPLEPSATPCGCLVCGENLIAVDMVAVRLMGFDVERLRQFSLLQDHAWDFGFRKTQDIEVLYNGTSVSGGDYFSSSFLLPFKFRPPFGWRGQIELNKTAIAGAAIAACTGNESQSTGSR
jgi:uncharacterized protein (DUF362 family)